MDASANHCDVGDVAPHRVRCSVQLLPGDDGSTPHRNNGGVIGHSYDGRQLKATYLSLSLENKTTRETRTLGGTNYLPDQNMFKGTYELFLDIILKL